MHSRTDRLHKQELMDLLRELGVRPSRRLGQNFLLDPNMMDALVRGAAPESGERVLEIGPGPGLLTRRLLETGVQVTAVEVDHRFASWLRAEFADASAVALIEADACKLDYDRLFRGRPFRCIANLPYSIASPLLAKFALLEHPPHAVHVLVQRETAERIAGSPGTRAYGALSVRVQCVYAPRLLRRVPPQVFWPMPRVDSAFLELRLRPAPPDVRVRRAVSEMARVAFGRRRRKAFSLLRERYGEGRIERAFLDLGLPLDARAENLPVAAYLALAVQALEAGG